MENIFGGLRQHVLLKKFTIFLKFKFLKKLRYSVIFVLSQPELRMHIDASHVLIVERMIRRRNMMVEN